MLVFGGKNQESSSLNGAFSFFLKGNWTVFFLEEEEQNTSLLIQETGSYFFSIIQFYQKIQGIDPAFRCLTSTSH